MSNSNWWASKLGSPSPQTPLPATALPARPAPQAPQPVAPVMPARQDQSCPNCRSGNYGKLTPETRARCYDCGYPIVQQGSGISGINGQGSGPTQPSRQAAGGGWNPTSIVDRIG